MGFLQLQGPQHGGTQRPHGSASEGLPGRQGCPGGAGWVGRISAAFQVIVGKEPLGFWWEKCI